MDFGQLLIYVICFFGLYTSIFFLITIYENRNNKKPTKNRRFPKVAVIVPVFNEESTVMKTLQSLFKLQYPKSKLDIIVVDDNSTDKTWQILKNVNDPRLRVFRKPKDIPKGKHYSLNFALQKTDAEFAGALDADSLVNPNTLELIIRHFKNKEVAAVTPSMKIYKPHTFLGRVQSMEYLIGLFLRKAFTFIGSQHVTPGPFTIYRKSFFEKYGYYRKAHNTEDIEIALRIQKHNKIIDYAPDAYVYTMELESFKSLYKQRLRWYHGFICNLIDYRCLFGKKHGNLGMFVLPSALVSVALVIASLGYAIYKTGDLWIQHIKNFIALDFDIIRLFTFDPDLFFINTTGVMVLSFVTLVLGLVVVVMAVRIGKEQNVTFSYVLFALTYWFLFAFWWIAAILAKLFGREVRWGHKTDQC